MKKFKLPELFRFRHYRAEGKSLFVIFRKERNTLPDLSSSEAGTTDWTKIFYSLVIGFVCGLIGVLFRHSVNALSRATYLSSIGDSSMMWALPGLSILIFLPLAALLSSWLVYRYAPEAAGTGSAAYIDAFHHRGGVIKPRVTIIKYIASTLNLGCGTSGGFEGPIVLMGAGAGSWIAQKVKRIKKDIHVYMVSGTAAGISAVFLAPLGGALTAIEMLYREDYETRALVPALLASVTGYFTATLFGCGSFAVQEMSFSFQGISEVPAYLLFTLVCSAAGWLFVKMFDLVKNISDKSVLPRFLYPVIGALCVAVMGLFFPMILGPRFSVLVDASSGTKGVLAVFMILMAKMAATSLAIGSGGSGGIFGPSLIMGGFLGIAFSRFLELAGFPLPVPGEASMMLVGMAGFFASVSKAPFGSVIMVCEIGGTFSLLPPLLIVCLLSIVMTKNFTIYKTQEENRFKSPAHKLRLIEGLEHSRNREESLNGKPE